MFSFRLTSNRIVKRSKSSRELALTLNLQDDGNVVGTFGSSLLLKYVTGNTVEFAFSDYISMLPRSLSSFLHPNLKIESQENEVAQPSSFRVLLTGFSFTLFLVLHGLSLSFLIVSIDKLIFLTNVLVNNNIDPSINFLEVSD